MVYPVTITLYDGERVNPPLAPADHPFWDRVLVPKADPDGGPGRMVSVVVARIGPDRVPGALDTAVGPVTVRSASDLVMRSVRAVSAPQTDIRTVALLEGEIHVYKAVGAVVFNFGS